MTQNVLSIQSHVVHGYVGNKLSTFPLQMLGWDVDVLNTVSFSNHTGYGKVHGTLATGHELDEIFAGLVNVGVEYDALLTGYTANGAALAAVGKLGSHLKQQRPQCLWLLDPVMGDEGQMYVEETVIPIYRSILQTGHVDIITPNQYEAELLLGREIGSVLELREGIKTLHERYNIGHIVVTSLSEKFVPENDSEDDLEHDLESKPVSGELLSNSKYIYTVVSSQGADCYVFKVPQLDSYFTGVGDLFSLLLLDRLKQGLVLVDSVNEVLSVMSQVLHKTQELTRLRLGADVVATIGDSSTMRECELRIVECRDVYERRERVFSPQLIEDFCW